MATGGNTVESKLPAELPLDFLKKITNDFSDERLLGTGAFGSVYKGILEDGGVIAVKRLGENSPVPSEKIFANEVQNMMVLKNENIVKMVGFCRETHKKLVTIGNRHINANITETVLCYEYFQKGSLDKHIFDESTTVDWEVRFKIIKGISKGLQFLHNLPRPLRHLGLKPQNILLDDNMAPKIADFGFSRIFDQGQTRMKTGSVVGTVLGLIILEITTREKNSSSTDQKHAREYIQGVTENWNLEQIMVKYPELDADGISQVENCIRIGLQCVDIDQESRPTINEIVNMLNS
ncbi:putative receptor-like protein kinase At4g00960 isoform X2 [Oryza brachyantha]|uniref:putative receptor-like protein kinase At4g00960 isoform X2 n=1 Tax=Oryza brachyantha TaxID=4533 RepID=UPI0003EAA03F|nr:putative receptor-like protein kinase At4g00960 isoform X2 [Oryza brachyantha]